jgi:putative ABC transport system ATP-binding protein
MLNISNLALGYNEKQVVSLAELKIDRGEHYMITGASGTGKTTLLYGIAGLIPPMRGTVTLESTNLFDLSESKRDRFRGRHIGIIFQTLHLVRSLSVIDNLMLAAYAANIPADFARAQELLYQLGIHHKQHMLPEALSQGQAQRVAIARAVLNQPALIVADEPTSSLDDANCEIVMGLILKAALDTNAALLISTHDNRVKHHFKSAIHLEAPKQ